MSYVLSAVPKIGAEPGGAKAGTSTGAGLVQQIQDLERQYGSQISAATQGLVTVVDAAKKMKDGTFGPSDFANVGRAAAAAASLIPGAGWIVALVTEAITELLSFLWSKYPAVPLYDWAMAHNLFLYSTKYRSDWKAKEEDTANLAKAYQDGWIILKTWNRGYGENSPAAAWAKDINRMFRCLASSPPPEPKYSCFLGHDQGGPHPLDALAETAFGQTSSLDPQSAIDSVLKSVVATALRRPGGNAWSEALVKAYPGAIERWIQFTGGQAVGAPAPTVVSESGQAYMAQTRQAEPSEETRPLVFNTGKIVFRDPLQSITFNVGFIAVKLDQLPAEYLYALRTLTALVSSKFEKAAEAERRRDTEKAKKLRKEGMDLVPRDPFLQAIVGNIFGGLTNLDEREAALASAKLVGAAKSLFSEEAAEKIARLSLLPKPVPQVPTPSSGSSVRGAPVRRAPVRRAPVHRAPAHRTLTKTSAPPALAAKPWYRKVWPWALISGTVVVVAFFVYRKATTTSKQV